MQQCSTALGLGSVVGGSGIPGGLLGGGEGARAAGDYGEDGADAHLGGGAGVGWDDEGAADLAVTAKPCSLSPPESSSSASVIVGGQNRGVWFSAATGSGCALPKKV